jgi:hypothetical protein
MRCLLSCLPRLRPAALLVSLVVGSAYGAETAPAWFRPDLDARATAGADGLVVWRSTSFRLGLDGGLTRQEEFAVRNLGGAIGRLGVLDPRLRWNESQQELKVKTVRTWRANGEALDAGPNSLVPTTPDPLALAPFYAEIREMVVAHVGIEVGSTSLLAWEMRGREPLTRPFWGHWEVDGPLPVISERLLLELPENLHLTWSSPAGFPQPELRRVGGLVSYEFRGHGLPALNEAEDLLQPLNRRRIVWSTAPDWACVRQWLESLALPAILVEPGLQNRADRLVLGAQSELERVARIHDFVLHGVRSIEWPISELGFRARPAADVLESGAGHALDKAVLEATLLEAAGLRATLAFVASLRDIPREIPNPDALNEVWLVVDADGETLFLNPMTPAERLPAARRAGHAALFLDGASQGVSALQDAKTASNSTCLNLEISVREEEEPSRGVMASGSLRISLAGTYDTISSLEAGADEAHRRLADGVLAAMGGPRVTKLSVHRETSRQTEFSADLSDLSLIAAPSGLISLRLPRPANAISGSVLQSWRGKRTLSFDLGPSFVERVRVVLHLPDSLEAVYIPPPVSRDGGFGTFSRQVSVEGNDITILSRLAIESGEIDPTRWPSLREMLAESSGDAGSLLLLKRKP